jgi:hypothetical protein
MVCAGLALLGFGSVGYARGTTPAATTTVASGSCESGIASSARISVDAGSAAVAFTVPDGCTGVAVSLVSYTATAPNFDPASAQQQVLFRASSVTAPAGAQALTVALPPCFFQVDFVFGAPLQTLGPAGTGNFYGEQGRLILAWTGGSGPCTTTTTTTVVTTSPSTTPTTSTAGPPTTTAPATAIPPTTTPSVPSTTTVPPGTTNPAAPPPTTFPTSTGITTAATTTTSVGSPPATTTTRSHGGPSTPPPTRPSHPTATRNAPPLPFTGLPLTSLTGVGLALLVAGLLIRFFARGSRGSLVPAMALVPAGALGRATAPGGLLVEARPFDYRVCVPGFGSGASIDEAEQKLLDRRWARFGSRTLGAPGRRAPVA